MRNTNKSKSTPMYFVGVLICFTAFSGLLLSASHIYADNNTSGIANVSVNVPAICSLTVDPDEHAIDITPGNAATIGYSDIKAVCNDPAGLAVYAVGYTNDTYGNNDFVATVNNNTYTIPSDNVANPTTSQWNMILSPIAGDYVPTIANSFDTAHAVPTTYTKVAYRNTATDLGDNATGANFRATFNVYVDNTQAAGTYTAKVKFLLVHPNVLTYDDQTGQPNTVQPSTLPCEPAEYDTFDSSVTHYLQNVSQWANQVALEQEVTAYDIRDNQAYKVKRLKMSANGCDTALWMSNLNLGSQALANGVTQLDSTNTNLASGASAIPTATFVAWNRTTSGNSTSFTNPKFTPLTVSNTPNSQAEDSYGNKYGTLYNYAAASAGTYIYEMGQENGNATSDLCPSGWRMPTGGNSGEFKALTTAYSLTSNTQNATTLQEDLGFSLAGFFGDGAPTYHESEVPEGNYWSSTIYSGGGNYRHILYLDESVINSSGLSSRILGHSIRCISDL